LGFRTWSGDVGSKDWWGSENAPVTGVDRFISPASSTVIARKSFPNGKDDVAISDISSP